MGEGNDLATELATDEGGFGLTSRTLGGLPIVNHVLDRLGLPALLDEALGEVDGRSKLTPAAAIRLVITNLVLGREPLYALGEWAARFDPALLAMAESEVAAVNDDRVGRALDGLFDADRAHLLTAVMLRAISEFSVSTSQLHNDSASISVHGAYRSADGTGRRGKATPVITHGHSKDHRPDLKQLVWILTVSADGAVPITYRLAGGNTVDYPTHVPTWDGLVALTGRVDFLYVADSKLCSRQAMAHIAGRGGRFVTVMPRSRKEDAAFRDWLSTHTPVWTEAAQTPGPRQGEPSEVYCTTPAQAPPIRSAGPLAGQPHPRCHHRRRRPGHEFPDCRLGLSADMESGQQGGRLSPARRRPLDEYLLPRGALAAVETDEKELRRPTPRLPHEGNRPRMPRPV